MKKGLCVAVMGAALFLSAQEKRGGELIILDKSRDIQVVNNEKIVKFGIRHMSPDEIKQGIEKLKKLDNKIHYIKVDETPNKDGIYWGEARFDTSLQRHVIYRYLSNVGVEYINIGGERKSVSETLEHIVKEQNKERGTTTTPSRKEKD